jgi:DNA-binding winged helix-turn-helix (wHTH) protein/succinate dehydrogenase flavin-adding protein (antitoxin of CptAB toxin-antitoxin module)
MVLGYKFANFYLDMQSKSLLLAEKPLAITERQFKLLTLLVEASPNSVSKKQLADDIWDEVIVSDWSLFRLISDTRQILGDDGEHQQVIRTSRGIGFCISQVQVVEATTEPQAQPPTKQPNTRWRAFKIALSLLILMTLSTLIYQHYQHLQLVSAMQRIANYQDNTYTAFKVQVARRNELAAMLEQRLSVSRDKQFEKFFSHYFEQLNAQEHFVFKQIRAITDTGLYLNNQGILDELNAHPDIFDIIEKAQPLQQHLTFWLNKYHSVFKQRQDMCLLYVGVEDGLPYPSGVDQDVKKWLDNQ